MLSSLLLCSSSAEAAADVLSLLYFIYLHTEGEVTDPGTDNSFPNVKAVQGWGIRMRPNAPYRK